MDLGDVEMAVPEITERATTVPSLCIFLSRFFFFFNPIFGKRSVDSLVGWFFAITRCWWPWLLNYYPPISADYADTALLQELDDMNKPLKEMEDWGRHHPSKTVKYDVTGEKIVVIPPPSTRETEEEEEEWPSSTSSRSRLSTHTSSGGFKPDRALISRLINVSTSYELPPASSSRHSARLF